MKKSKIISIFAAALMILAAFQSCQPTPEYFSQVDPEKYFDSQEKVWQRFDRPFVDWATNITNMPTSYFTAMQTLTTDEILMPNRNGDWYDGGFYINCYIHNFAPNTETYANYAWDGFSHTVALAWNALEDIDKYVDFKALGFPDGTRESMLNQLKVLVAYNYWVALDLFGGVPLYESNEGEAKARATDQETFEFIERLLKEALPNLPKRAANTDVNGTITQGTVAALLVRLYFNAKPYIGKEMYTECATLCQEILNGNYGSYAPAGSFQEIFGWGNETCNELLWAIPSNKGNREAEPGRRNYGTHYGTWAYLQNPDAMSWNGLCLVPSLDINGKSYKMGDPNPAPKQYKLGSPYAKFESNDLRKKNYLYGRNGKGTYEGMFLHGKLVNPLPGGGACVADGSREYLKGDTLPMPDQVAQLGPDIPDDPTTPENEAKARYPEGRKEGAMYAEENSGVRLLKFSPCPSQKDNDIRFNPDVPIIRLTEIIYTLAECKFRAGEKAAAAKLINDIRARYFTAESPDPNPVPDDFDEYRLLDEWLIEFIGEGRRRIDLVRWDKYTTEEWWDHPADGPSKSHFNRCPIPASAMGANNKLVQTPGYGN